MNSPRYSYFTAIAFITVFALSAQFSHAQFWDSWTNTYSPTWTPSLDYMINRGGNTYSSGTIKPEETQPTSTPTTSSRTNPPTDFSVPEGMIGLRTVQNGYGPYYRLDKENSPQGIEVNRDKMEIRYRLQTKNQDPEMVDHIKRSVPTTKIGEITHKNEDKYWFGYYDPKLLEIDGLEYEAQSDSVKPPPDFTFLEESQPIRIKEWGKIKYLTNNLLTKNDMFIIDYNSKTIFKGFVRQEEEIGKITYLNTGPNVDSFGYIYPKKIYVPPIFTNFDSNGFALPFYDVGVPADGLLVRIGEWGSVYYADTNKQIANVYGLFRKFGDHSAYKIIYDNFLPGDENKTLEIGEFKNDNTTYVYKYGYIYPNLLPASEEPKTQELEKVPTFSNDVPNNVLLSQAVLYANQNNWIPQKTKFRPNSRISRCGLAGLVMRASNEPAVNEFEAVFSDIKKNHSKAAYIYAGFKKGYWKEYKKGSGKFGCNRGMRRSMLAKILKKMGKTMPNEFVGNPKKYLTKADAVMIIYKVFGLEQ